MEVYYKDLISEDASLDKLVDDLTRLVQGADDLVAEAGSGLEPQHQQEIANRLERLKERCRQFQQQFVAGARATDKAMHRYPYSALGLALSIGLLAGVLLGHSRSPESVETGA